MFKQNISKEIWGGENGKYRLRDSDGNIIDQTPEDTCSRVAKGLADIEVKDKEYWSEKFYKILSEGKASGGGRIMANIGSGNHKANASSINCVVLRQIPDSMEGIMQTAKEAALVLRAGCGVGYDFSTIRPKGSYVYGAGSETSGVISFMKIFDATCSTVMSGGSRRGAQLGALDIQHPEVESFISCKREDGMLRYFNLSILITDRFMEAVEKNDDWHLWFWRKIGKTTPSSNVKLIVKDDIPFNHAEYDFFSFDKNHTEVDFGNCTPDDIFAKVIYKSIPAKELFDQIMKSTYDYAEPGFLLVDKLNKENTLYFTEIQRASNPCVTKDTWVQTLSGPRQVSKLIGKQFTAIVDGKMHHSGPEGFFKTADKNTVTLKTKEGFSARLTNDHRVRKIVNLTRNILSTEWSETGALVPGDKILLNNHKELSWNGKYGEKEGYLMGSLLGDGTLKKNVGVLSVWESNQEIVLNSSNGIMNEISKSLSCIEKRSDFSGWSEIKERSEFRITLSGIKDLANSLGIEQSFKKITYMVEEASSQFYIGFLKGFFDADGSVQGNQKKGVSIRLAQSDLLTLEAVQRMLLRLGIFSKIYKNRRVAQNRMMPDGKGGLKSYWTKANHELVVSGRNMFSYNDIIGFADNNKSEKLKNLISSYKRAPNKEQYIATVESVTDNNYIEEVFDVQIPGINTFDGNGFHMHNCGEQNLGFNNSCLLGSMILNNYIDRPFEEDASFDWVSFSEDVKTATRMLDNVVEVSNLPLQVLTDQLNLKRRHGLGFTGLGTAFNMMNMRYGGDISILFSDKLMHTIARVSLEENIALAKEKGSAPIFDSLENREAVLKSQYLKRLIDSLDNKDQIIEDILKYGLRFSHATSIAPTGTMSLTWGNNCSNGLEPSFANAYMRNIRQPGKKTKVQEEVMSYEFLLWKEKFGDKELPESWCVADDLSVDDHINIQSAIQKWTDAACSKTINIPTDYPFEDFKTTYFKGWKAGLKGITTFRFNPEAFSGVLVRKEDLDNTKYVFITEDNEEVVVNGSDEIFYDGELHNAANLFDALKEGLYGDM